MGGDKDIGRISGTNTVLVKLRPSRALRAAESLVTLRPLYDTPEAKSSILGVGAEPQWFLADLPDGAATPWDLAQTELSRHLGVSESDVIFAEPDIYHNVYLDVNERQVDQAFAVGENCEASPQDGRNGKILVPDRFAWHLEDEYTQLARARGEVTFTEPRTRIAHIDTGYSPTHVTVPEHIAHHLERNFVTDDGNPGSAEDPDNWRLLMDNSGHGTGTISILAGGKVPAFGDVYLGGAPGAEILPLRIADSVVLLKTSALARALRYALKQACDVVTLSMGGLPSHAWGEAVDEAYLGGLCIVAAAGNNTNGIPTRHIVYPARYSRVIAVCGAMADHEPYAGLTGLATLEGNYGPDSRMAFAIAAYTPNIPWARFGCSTTVRLNGEGTSAATPQVAAAVALWLEKYKGDLPRNWRRIEAVRHALFSSAKLRDSHRSEFGNGILQASEALRIKPVLGLPRTKPDNDSFPFLRIITGLGMVEAPPRERMFNLELSQRWLVSPPLQEIIPDPDSTSRPKDTTIKRLMEAVIEDKEVSFALRRHVAARYPLVAGRPAPHTERSEAVVPKTPPSLDALPALRNPAYRRLRVYATDPSLSAQFDTAAINEVTLKIRWEDLKKPGPVGEYLAVEDKDAAGNVHRGVNLNDPRLLARDGWAPSEGNPQFHQQMVYAVAMKTIENFETALGRPVLWRPRTNTGVPGEDSGFREQLIVHPHAIWEANAYYSPEQVALLFGYFDSSADDPGNHVPGSRIYTCLSHDIIVHETTHAILDGMHRRFNEPTNPDVLALHEAFADIVALMQHFTISEVLAKEISRTRGDIETESMLGSLAIQFGHATGGRGALRNAIGSIESGVWKRMTPDPIDLPKRWTPHSRGAILVAAVFDAFIAIYKARIADLLRIYTGGTGVMPKGAIHPDLVSRLADEASKSAGHVLTMCIRALDYLPPVDVTFFEFLRALITADYDLVSDDRYNYRVAFVEAFRRRGIYPVNLTRPSHDTLRTLSVDTLRWQGLDFSKLPDGMAAHYDPIIQTLKRYADACSYISDREKLFSVTCERRRELKEQLKGVFIAAPKFGKILGLDPKLEFEVDELRRAIRVGPDGRHIPQIIVALTQSRKIKEIKKKGTPGYLFRGGSTFVVDLSVPEVKYQISKDIGSPSRQERTADFVRDAVADPLRALFFGPGHKEPFAVLHALGDEAIEKKMI